MRRELAWLLVLRN